MEAVNLLMTRPGPHSKPVSGLGIRKQNLNPSFMRLLPESALLGLSYVTEGHSTEAHIMSPPRSENQAGK